jgi:hypothetical protein
MWNMILHFAIRMSLAKLLQMPDIPAGVKQDHPEN